MISGKDYETSIYTGMERGPEGIQQARKFSLFKNMLAYEPSLPLFGPTVGWITRG